MGPGPKDREETIKIRGRTKRSLVCSHPSPTPRALVLLL